MKRLVGIGALALSFIAGAGLSAQVRDMRDLESVRQEVNQAIQGMERARAANHYDMKGHGQKAEEHLRAAERELGMAVEAAKLAR